MKCNEKGCPFPAGSNGWCVKDQWRAPGADVIPGVMGSSLSDGPRNTGANISAKPAEVKWPHFSAKITIAPSTLNPGRNVYLHHFPPSKTEAYGVVASMAFAISRDRYVSELARRFKITADPDAIKDPTPAVPKEPEEMETAEPKATPVAAVAKTQFERVLDAVLAGATTAKQVGTATGLVPNTCSAVLSQLKSKGKIHRVRVNEDGSIIWALGKEPVTVALEPDPLPVTPPPVIRFHEKSATPIAIRVPSAPVHVAAVVPDEILPAVTPNVPLDFLQMKLAIHAASALSERVLNDIAIQLCEEDPERPETWTEFVAQAKRVKKLRTLSALLNEIDQELLGILSLGFAS